MPGSFQHKGKDAYERASRLALGLKALAKSERIAIVAAMQLSRAGGDGSEPVSRSMLRDSGVLEESVDALLGIWRPGKAAGLDPAETAKPRKRPALLCTEEPTRPRRGHR